MQLDQRDKLIGDIYAAASGVGDWSGVLEDIADATGSLGVVLRVHDLKNGWASAIAPRSDPDFIKSYEAHYWRQNILASKYADLKLGQIEYLPQMMDAEKFRRSAFYNEWWRPQGAGVHAMGAELLKEDGRSALLNIQKKHDAGGYGSEEFDFVRSLVPHLVRAVDVHRRLSLAERLSVQDGKATSAAGLAVLDTEGRILAAGPRSRGLLKRAGCLGLDEVVHSPGSEIACILADIRHKSGRHRYGGCISVPLLDGSFLRMKIYPCAEGGQLESGLEIDRPAAFLDIALEADETAQKMRALTERFGLTRAEAVVALEIARGDGRQAVADRLGIKVTTVRSHLESVFSKMGIHRQAELAKIVAHL